MTTKPQLLCKYLSAKFRCMSIPCLHCNSRQTQSKIKTACWSCKYCNLAACPQLRRPWHYFATGISMQRWQLYRQARVKRSVRVSWWQPYLVVSLTSF